MEASQTTADQLRERAERQTAAGQATPVSSSSMAEAPVPQGAPMPGAEPLAAPEAHEEAVSGLPQAAPVDEANPAREQAPVATDTQEAIMGDPGFRNEQQPVQNEATPTNVNQPVRTSAPPPSAQSGVPLPEDRDAGVEPGNAPGANPDGPAHAGSIERLG